MADRYGNAMDPLDGPTRKPAAITPADATALTDIPKRIFVGTGGNVTLRGVDAAADVVYKNVGDGVYLNVRPSHVRATGTTASDIVGEY